MECGVRKEEEKEDNSLTGIKLPDITKKRIVPYGAGNIGKRVYFELERRNIIIAWVDKRYEVLKAPRCKKIVSPEEIKKLNYDYIIVAIINRELVSEVVWELEGEYGVGRDEILLIERDEGKNHG